jgi:peptide/bleomycin uptake transporter
MIKSFFWTRKWAVWAYLGGVILVLSLWTQVQLSVKFNTWYGLFFSLLQEPTKHNVVEFWSAIFQFCYLAFPYILLVTATGWLTRIYTLRWREAITDDYIPRWRFVSHDVEGASQRIQEDAQRFSSIVQSLGVQVIRAFMTLIAFIPVLWYLSEKINIPILKDIPGSLVWVAALVSVGGLTVSWFVGWALPGLEYSNQKVEAAFRKELVLGEDDKSLHAQPETLLQLFLGIKKNYHRLYMHYGYFDIWSNIWDQGMVLVPFLLMGPALFAGLINLGLIMQVKNAFTEVQSSFGIFMNNFVTMTELRSIRKRLVEFEANLDRRS